MENQELIHPDNKYAGEFVEMFVKKYPNLENFIQYNYFSDKFTDYATIKFVDPRSWFGRYSELPEFEFSELMAEPSQRMTKRQLFRYFELAIFEQMRGIVGCILPHIPDDMLFNEVSDRGYEVTKNNN